VATSEVVQQLAERARKIREIRPRRQPETNPGRNTRHQRDHVVQKHSCLDFGPPRSRARAFAIAVPIAAVAITAAVPITAAVAIAASTAPPVAAP
jgi:hypothetical protein